MLYAAKLYSKKLGNSFQALRFIEEANLSNSSISFKNSLENLYLNIKNVNLKTLKDSRDTLDFQNYFIITEEFDMIRKHMLIEIKNHFDFWRKLSMSEIDTKYMLDLSYEIEKSHCSVKKRWQKNSKSFSSFNLLFLLTYGLYLDFIKGMPEQSVPILRKLQTYSQNQNYKAKGGILSDDSALIVASVEHDKIGTIIDASETVKNIFEITKDKLIGLKINSLMPEFISRSHDKFMRSHIQSSSSQKEDREINTFGKTMKGALIHLKIKIYTYPYFDKGINLMAYIKKSETEDDILIVDMNGIIVECSDKLQGLLNIYTVDRRIIEAHEVCPALERVNIAFNHIYVPQLNLMSISQNVIGSTIPKDGLQKRTTQTLLRLLIEIIHCRLQTLKKRILISSFFPNTKSTKS